MPNFETVDITPSPRILRVLGEIPFQTWQCFAELMDNSIDALLKQPDSDEQKAVWVNWSGQKVGLKDRTIEVSDNAQGMTLEQMQNAVRAGYSNCTSARTWSRARRLSASRCYAMLNAYRILCATSAGMSAGGRGSLLYGPRRVVQSTRNLQEDGFSGVPRASASSQSREAGRVVGDMDGKHSARLSGVLATDNRVRWRGV